jgi:hypothetical protein
MVKVIKDKDLYYEKTNKKLRAIMDAKAVNIKVNDKLEERLLTSIPSSVRQEVIAQLQNNIKSLG